MTETADKVRFHRCAGKEFAVDARIVKARHGAGVQAQSPCRDDEIGALQRSVPEGVALNMLFALVHEPALCVWIVREQLRKMLIEFEIVADDRTNGRAHRLRAIAF